MTQLSYWLLRANDQWLMLPDSLGAYHFPQGVAADFGNPKNALLIGEWQNLPCYAAEIDTSLDELQQKWPKGEWFFLRPIFQLAGEAVFTLLGRAAQLLDWQKNHRYCGRCAEPTEKLSDEFCMRCPACASVAYPRISPAVMVLIRRGDELLLARSPHFRPGMFSALAGFVEVGESLEQCAEREVFEEVGLKITNLRYFKSQPWPFPDSLMFAFFADYHSGDIVCEPGEIEAAAWYHFDALPDLPAQESIARRLIDAACDAWHAER